MTHFDDFCDDVSATPQERYALAQHLATMRTAMIMKLADPPLIREVKESARRRAAGGAPVALKLGEDSP